VTVKKDLRYLLLANCTKLSWGDIFGKSSLAELSLLDLPSWYGLRKECDLELGLFLRRLARKTEAAIKEAALSYPETALLATMPGVSLPTALAITLEIGDVARLPSAKGLVNFVGLRPFLYH
jgi:transposase